MRIAYYAPLKSPTHSRPSGDRRVAGLLMQALAQGGHRVELVSTFRSFDRDGDAERQAALGAQGRAFGEQLAGKWRAAPADQRPELWFTYHLYYKAPDWLGPTVSAALGIPYVIAEPSYAPKRAGGRWAIGHEASREAIQHASLLICPTRYDRVCLEPLVDDLERIVYLPPFLDATPFVAAAGRAPQLRAEFAAAHGIDAGARWIAVIAMMRPGDKLASYRELAAALALLAGRNDWRLVVGGGGAARAEIEALFERTAPGRVHLLGELAPAQVPELLAACDLYAWPAVNEAYGMAMLEAQAAGLPVASCRLRGVPDVVLDNRTGLLAEPGDPAAFAENLRRLLDDAALRARFAQAAATHGGVDRNLEPAARQLARSLEQFATRAA